MLMRYILLVAMPAMRYADAALRRLLPLLRLCRHELLIDVPARHY